MARSRSSPTPSRSCRLRSISWIPRVSRTGSKPSPRGRGSFTARSSAIPVAASWTWSHWPSSATPIVSPWWWTRPSPHPIFAAPSTGARPSSFTRRPNSSVATAIPWVASSSTVEGSTSPLLPHSQIHRTPITGSASTTRLPTTPS